MQEQRTKPAFSREGRVLQKVEMAREKGMKRSQDSPGITVGKSQRFHLKKLRPDYKGAGKPEWTESGRVLNWGIITLTAEIECAGSKSSKSKSGENVGEGSGVRRWDVFLTQRQCALWKAPELWNQTFPFECQRCHLPPCNLGVWGSIPFPAAGKQRLKEGMWLAQHSTAKSISARIQNHIWLPPEPSGWTMVLCHLWDLFPSALQGQESRSLTQSPWFSLVPLPLHFPVSQLRASPVPHKKGVIGIQSYIRSVLLFLKIHPTPHLANCFYSRHWLL